MNKNNITSNDIYELCRKLENLKDALYNDDKLYFELIKDQKYKIMEVVVNIRDILENEKLLHYLFDDITKKVYGGNNENN